MALPESFEIKEKDANSEVDKAGGKILEQTTGQKVGKTICLVIVWVCLGLFLEITGPTLIDLKLRTHSGYEAISTAVEGRSAGYFIGSAVGGVLVDKFGLYCDLMVALSLDFGAIVTVGVPWVPTSELVFVLCLLQGTFEGVINIAGQKLIMNMWREKSASPLHILHAGFGIGSFIIPLVANPFLAELAPDDNADSITTMASTNNSQVATILKIVNVSQADPEVYLKPSRIEIAYLIPALITVLVSIIFYMYHCTSGKEREAMRNESTRSNSKALSFREMFNPATCAGGKLFYGIQIFVLVCLYFFQVVGGERVAGKFIRAYSIDHFGFSNDDGAYINTTFWIVFTVGRSLGLITARFIPIRILIVLETGGVMVTTICLVIFGGNSSTAFWVLMPVLGFFLAPLFPSGIGWTNFHIEMTGIGITTLLLGGSVGGLAYMKLIGYLYEHFGPVSFLYTLLGYGIAVFVLSVLMDLVGSSSGNRFVEEVEGHEEKEERIDL